jgi:hypothetical protein
MKEKIAVFNTTIAEIMEVKAEDEEFNHPLLTVAKFVFSDDKGNANKQGIKAEDFDDVIRTAIHMPVKMRYLGVSAGGHQASVPIGHIIKMEKDTIEDTNRLVASAVLYSDEFSEEVAFLKESFAKGEAPGISYEVLYLDSIEENGIQWLKKIFTKAATFVRSPAYGKRTALLALATRQDIDSEEFLNDFVTMANEWSGNESSEESEEDTQEGGKLMEEELQRLKAEAEAFKAEIEALKETNREVSEKLEIANAEISKKNQEALVTAREKAFVEAGFTLEADAEKAEKKRAFWLSLSEEAFEEYLADLKAAKEATKIAAASKKEIKPELPKLAVASGNDKVEYTIEDLKAELREAARR